MQDSQHQRQFSPGGARSANYQLNRSRRAGVGSLPLSQL